MEIYRVTASSLNMRSAPIVSGSNRIAVLPQGQEVEKTDGTHEPWWLVSTQVGGENLEGYVHSEYLVKKNEFDEPIESNSIKAVHLKEGKTTITRDRAGGRAYPLGESNRPTRTAIDMKGKAQQIWGIIEWLNVEGSVRYQPKGSETYCNIYAYDYCYLAGAYIPRVWWKPKSLIELSKGNKVPVLYDNTVKELNANSLHDWLDDFGDDFGWSRTFTVDTAQLAANDGKVVVVCAKRVANEKGHICVIVPEKGTFAAKRRSNGSISKPLQSQAGDQNFKYKTANIWWTSIRFQSFGIWIHD